MDWSRQRGDFRDGAYLMVWLTSGVSRLVWAKSQAVGMSAFDGLSANSKCWPGS